MIQLILPGLLQIKEVFPHYVMDITPEFNNIIIDDFINEYLHGRTPNPCARCNTHIKSEHLLKFADQMDCEFIATGHYANIRYENGRYIISKGLDFLKDQSYILWGISRQRSEKNYIPTG